MKEDINPDGYQIFQGGPGGTGKSFNHLYDLT